MSLPIPSLDDRRFDDLVQEATARLEAHTPEYSNVAPGDPGAALIDLFAWLTDTILYRQNLIPLRQRRAFMNLLAIPLQPASPATGIVCVDAPALPLPAPLAVGDAQFTAGAVRFTSTTDLQPTPLQLVPMVKARYTDPDPVKQTQLVAMLRTLYNIDQPQPFVAQPAFGDTGKVDLSNTIDGTLWLALTTPKKFPATADAVRSALAGITLSIGLAPVDDIPGDQAFDQATALPARALKWAVLTQGPSGLRQLALDVVQDTSNGGRQRGVALLRLPRQASLLAPPAADDPMFAGTHGTPPELPATVAPTQLVAWLTLAPADGAGLTLSYLSVNAVGIVGRVIETDQPLGTATGAGDASFRLRGSPVDPTSLVLQVWQGSQAMTWTAVDNFGRAGRNDTVFVLDATAGTVRFGDGIRGMRPPQGAVIVAARYAWGGGAATNLAAGSIKAIAPIVGTVRHEIPTTGGLDGETVAAAERRIPAFLANRDRAVTLDDFQSLALATPGLTLGRAEVVAGLMPGADPAATRTGVPGVVSVFVFPDAAPAMGGGPLATLAQLKDVFAFLRQRILIGTQLFVLCAEPVPVYASSSIRLLTGADPVAVRRALQQMLAAYLWPIPPGGPDGAGWQLGRAVMQDELLTQIARVPGVLAADDLALFQNSGTAWTRTARVDLQAWQVPALMGADAATDGSAAPPPPPDNPAASAPGQYVPFVPTVC